MNLPAITPAVKKLLIQVAAAVVVWATAFAIGAAVMGSYKDAKHDAYVAKAAETRALEDAALQADARAKQKAQDDITLASAQAQIITQERIVTRYRTRTEEVPRYVTVQQDAVACVSYGLVRVLDAAALGRDPADLELPPGVTDDTCTALTASALAAGILGNYAVSDANAAQLDGLIADVKARIDAAQPSTSSPPRDGHSWNDVEKDHPGLTIISELAQTADLRQETSAGE
jgi:hypothetical protein